MRLLIVTLLVCGALRADEKVGKGLTLAGPTPLAQIEANPNQYTGKLVQVRGRVTEVCQAMGCWMNIVDPVGEKSMRIKVNDGEIVFPKSSVGKIAVAEGKLVKLELTREQAVERARHEAEEQGRKFDPGSVKSGGIVYLLQGVGAVIRD